MARENKFKPTKKMASKKTQEVKLKRKGGKQDDSSDDEDDSEYIPSEEQDDDEDDDDFDEEDEDFDELEYKKFLQKIFPSKYMKDKIKNSKKGKNNKKEESEDEEEEPVKKSKKVVKKDSNKVSNKVSKKKKFVEEDEEEDEWVDDDGQDEEDGKSNKINMVFTIGLDDNYDEDDDDYDDDDEEDDETEDEDESVSTDNSDEDDEEDEEDEEEEPVQKKSSKKIKPSDENIVMQVQDIINQNKDNSTNSSSIGENEAFLKQLKEVYEKNPGNAMIKECIDTCENKLSSYRAKREKKTQKQKDKHLRIFRRVLSDKNVMNDFNFFKGLGIEHQRKMIKEVREINKITRIEKPYRMTLLESTIPVNFKAAAIKKINTLRFMDPSNSEFYKIKNWVDTFMKIPFGVYKTLDINIDQGIDVCHEFMETARNTLDSAVYGLNDAKMQIMQLMGQLITNPTSIGTAIAIQGPMGTGKTTLVKEGISKILNRPFAFIALGGATDSSFLEGHSYTYEGSVWGKIVQIIIDSKCMNPVIYFDELDKISETPKGEEIAGILTHLTDTSQNSQFHDKYFSEIEFDLSKCLFIFSYNDESKVNPILRDRMYRIQTKGYEKKQKTVISNEYLLPRIQEQVKFSPEEIIIPEESIHYIIDEHCQKEDGVRNLKRCLEIIHTKLNLYRLMKPGSNLFEEDMALKVEFPLTVTKEIVDKLIKNKKEVNLALSGMYV